MTREEAIKWYNNEIRMLRLAPGLNGDIVNPDWDEQLQIHSLAVEALREQEGRKWISIEEQLPMIRVRVLVAYKAGVTIAEYRGYDVCKGRQQMYWCGTKGSKHVLSSVTHWMPLPEPPKEEV